jgi:D-3-phosphoglycerate dehydrogenase
MSDHFKHYRVLVTPTSYGKNEPALKTQLEAEVGEVVYNTTGRPLSADELLTLIPEVDGYIAGLDTINRQVIETADRLKVIARYGVGVDAVDLGAARERGIIVTNTPGANSGSVAELAVGLMISLARNITTAAQATRSGQWPRLKGLSLDNKIVGLLGFGAIGQQVARKLHGFDCRIIAYDPVADVEVATQLGVELQPRLEVITQADFISLHLPLLPETQGMVNEGFLNRMKPGAYLINTSRGELIVEDALFQALKGDHLTGAALDCFVQQPPAADNPLLSLPQVIATPHMGAHTDAATNAMGWSALNDCLAVLRGEQPAHRVV